MLNVQTAGRVPNSSANSAANSAADHVNRTEIPLPPERPDSIQITDTNHFSALMRHISGARRVFSLPSGKRPTGSAILSDVDLRVRIRLRGGCRMRTDIPLVLHSNGRCTIKKKPLIISSSATTEMPPLSLINEREAATMLTEPMTIAIWNSASAKSKFGSRSAA
jgi:hypothetical protein